MKLIVGLAALTAILIPAAPAFAAPVVAPTTAPTVAPTGKTAPAAGAVLVARYTFDAGAVDGKVADTSGRGPVLTVRGKDQGAVKFESGTTGGKYVAFPGVCAKTATTCASGLLEGPSDADLNPGTRLFRWSARVHVTKAQIGGSSNVVQKGVANTGSQWKLQIGATQGRAQCVMVGTGSKVVYVARSAATVADGAWHKVTCQRDGATLAVLVDDVQRGQVTIPATLSVSNNLPLRIGGANFSKRSDMYHGLLDDVYAELG
jgi:hypothetical protein